MLVPWEPQNSCTCAQTSPPVCKRKRVEAEWLAQGLLGLPQNFQQS